MLVQKGNFKFYHILFAELHDIIFARSFFPPNEKYVFNAVGRSLTRRSHLFGDFALLGEAHFRRFPLSPVIRSTAKTTLRS